MTRDKPRQHRLRPFSHASRVPKGGCRNWQGLSPRNAVESGFFAFMGQGAHLRSETPWSAGHPVRRLYELPQRLAPFNRVFCVFCQIARRAQKLDVVGRMFPASSQWSHMIGVILLANLRSTSSAHPALLFKQIRDEVRRKILTGGMFERSPFGSSQAGGILIVAAQRFAACLSGVIEFAGTLSSVLRVGLIVSDRCGDALVPVGRVIVPKNVRVVCAEFRVFCSSLFWIICAPKKARCPVSFALALSLFFREWFACHPLILSLTSSARGLAGGTAGTDVQGDDGLAPRNGVVWKSKPDAQRAVVLTRMAGMGNITPWACPMVETEFS